MSKWQFTKGLHDIGNGSYAYLQPDGGWGWSNAGFITDGGESLLVDTLFDERSTADMLSKIRSGTVLGSKDIDILVNTHSNPDHTFGNSLLESSRIISSKACAEEMKHLDPNKLAQMIKNAPELGKLGEFFLKHYGDFHFDGIRLTMPNEVFTDKLDIMVGQKQVKLLEVGPAHTAGDILIWVPEDKTIFTGDILFIDCTPMIWEGPVANWIAACDLIMGLDVETIVPGHGPITDKKGVAALKEYLVYITKEARKRYDAGLSVMEAVHDIVLGDYESWGDSERIVGNVHTLYQEFSNKKSEDSHFDVFRMMAEYALDPARMTSHKCDAC